jgi:hypothetical protein
LLTSSLTFFLKYAGELRIIALRRKKGNRSPRVHIDKDYTRAFARKGKRHKALSRGVVKPLERARQGRHALGPGHFPHELLLSRLC